VFKHERAVSPASPATTTTTRWFAAPPPTTTIRHAHIALDDFLFAELAAHLPNTTVILCEVLHSPDTL
jgi:hypothetical protein